MTKYIITGNDSDIDALVEGAFDCLVKEAGVFNAAGRILKNLGTSGVGKIYKGKLGKGMVISGKKLENIEKSYGKGILKGQLQGKGLTGQLVKGVQAVAEDHPTTFGISAGAMSAILVNKILKEIERNKSGKVPYNIYRYASTLSGNEVEVYSDDLIKEAKSTSHLVSEFLMELSKNDQVRASIGGSEADTDSIYRKRLIEGITRAKNEVESDLGIVANKLGEYRESMFEGIDMDKLAYRVGGHEDSVDYGFRKQDKSNKTIPILAGGAGVLAGSLLAKHKLDSKVMEGTKGIRGLGKNIQDFAKRVDNLSKKHDTPDHILKVFESIEHGPTRKESIQRFNDIKAEIKDLGNTMKKVKNKQEIPDVDTIYKHIDDSIKNNHIPKEIGDYLKDYATEVFKFK